MLALRLPKEIEDRLDTLAEKTGRTKSYYAKKAIMAFLEREEERLLALARLEDNSQGVSLEEIDRRFRWENRARQALSRNSVAAEPGDKSCENVLLTTIRNITMDWKISGTYFESCDCEATCPCVTLSPPTKGYCGAIIGWHIDKGHFGDVKLDGVSVAAMAYSPGHMMEGNWKMALYLDEKANKEQQDALVKIFSGQSGGHPAAIAGFVTEVLGVKTVPIDYRIEGKKRSLKIPNIADMEIESVTGLGGNEVVISNPPLCVVPSDPAVVARSLRSTYTDYGLRWERSGRAGFHSPFTYQP